MSSGTYLVTTASGSRYAIDTARMTLSRVPATATFAESLLAVMPE
jgi:hypothetical protein